MNIIKYKTGKAAVMVRAANTTITQKVVEVENARIRV